MIILNQLQKRFSHSFARSARKGTEKPTKYIYLLILIFIGLFMQAYIHNYNIVYMALFFTFAFSIASYPLGRNNIRALEVKLLASERIFAKRESSYTLAITPTQDVYDITVVTPTQKVHVSNIKEATTHVVKIQHVYEKRGSTVLESVECQSQFPLPHQSFFKVFDMNKTFRVYPQPLGMSLEQYLSQSQTLFGDKSDFEGIKDYEHGERLSEVYWPSLAKGTGMMSKHFSHTNEDFTLEFDFIHSGKDDEARLSQLTLWVLECEQRSLEFTIAINQKILNSKKMSSDEILTYLSLY